METELYQLYCTDAWSTNSSRDNLGVFSTVQKALQSLFVENFGGEIDVERFVLIFEKNMRLFIEKISIDESEGYRQIFDSNNSDDLKELKRIIFYNTIVRFSNDLGFLAVSEEDIPFDIDKIKCSDDVTDDLINEYLSEDNAVSFIKSNLL